LAALSEGEWAATTYRAEGRRGGRKPHVSVDPRGMILAQRLLEATVDDANTALDLLDTIQATITCVTADGAFFQYKTIVGDGLLTQ